MPRIGTGSSQNLVFNRGSHLKFAQNAQSHPDTDIANSAIFSKYYAEFNTEDFNASSTLLRPNRIPTGVTQYRGRPGPITVSFSFEMDAQAHRMELLLRQLLNSPTTADLTGATSGVSLLTGASNGAGSGSPQSILTAASVTAGTAITSLTNQIEKGQGPVQLNLTAAGSGIDVATPLKVVIIGEDRIGDPLTEEIDFTSASTKESLYYYYQVDKILPTAAPASTTLALTGQSDRKVVRLQTLRSYRQLPGMTVEMAEGTYNSTGAGNVSSTIPKAYVSGFNLRFTKDSLVTYNFNFEAKRVNYGLSPIMTTTQIPPSRATSSGPYAGGGHNFLPFQDGVTPFSGAGVCMTVPDPDDNSVRVEFPRLETFDITFDGGVDFTQPVCTNYRGDPFNRQRTITVSFTSIFHSDDKGLYDAYLAADVWEDVRLYLTAMAGGNEEVEFRFAALQFDTYIDKSVSGDGYMIMTRTATAVPSSDSLDDELKIYLRYDTIDGTREVNATNLGLGTYQ